MKKVSRKLFEACRTGNKAEVEELLNAKKVNVNFINDVKKLKVKKEKKIKGIKPLRWELDPLNPWTPLMIAVDKMELEIVKMLLKHPDIDPNTKGCRSFQSKDSPSCALFVAVNKLTFMGDDIEKRKKMISIVEEILMHPKTDPNIKLKPHVFGTKFFLGFLLTSGIDAASHMMPFLLHPKIITEFGATKGVPKKLYNKLKEQNRTAYDLVEKYEEVKKEENGFEGCETYKQMCEKYHFQYTPQGFKLLRKKEEKAEEEEEGEGEK